MLTVFLYIRIEYNQISVVILSEYNQVLFG
jgi:hypothetical protein